MDPSEYNKEGFSAKSRRGFRVSGFSFLVDRRDGFRPNATLRRTRDQKPGTRNPFSSADRLEERFEFLGPRRVPELPQRLGLDLTDPLARHVEGTTDFLEGMLGSVA